MNAQGFLIYSDETEYDSIEESPRNRISIRKNFLLDVRDIYSSYNIEKLIGINPFRHRFTDEIKYEVLHSKAVKRAMEDVLQNNPTISLSSIKEQVQNITNAMISVPNEKIMRGLCYAVQKILKRLYKNIHVIESQVQELVHVAQVAAERNIPLVIVPTHKSHIDYLVISWLFFHKGISMPFIAAGQNLDMPFVGSLLKSSGAFFIKRTLGSDPLYRAIFSEYITTLLAKGCNVEFFIEGGRSRTGKLLNPKMGILSMITDAYFNKRVEDCLIVPISIGYDKVIETEGYIKELLGRSKTPESLVQLIRAIELLRINFGNIDVRIGNFLSMKDYLNHEIQSRKLDPYALDSEIKYKSRRQLVNVLSYQTMYRINMITVALPTALVVTSLLTHEGRGMSKSDLVQKVEWLRSIILNRGGKVVTFHGNTSTVVDKVALLLSGAIGRHVHVLEMIYTPIKRFELSYYRNQVIHLFVSEAIIACCLYRFKASDKRKLTRVPLNELMASAQTLSRTLKHEFIYKVLPEFKEAFEETLHTMVKNKVIVIEEDQVSLHPEGFDTFKFLCFLLWPFIESYWMVSASFYALFPRQYIESTEYTKGIQQFGETLYYEGELNFFESVSKETTKLALIRFEERSVISKHVINDKGLCIYKLTENYANNEAKLNRLIEKMSSFRRKGKYRTTTGLVDIRRIANLMIPNKSSPPSKM